MEGRPVDVSNAAARQELIKSVRAVKAYVHCTASCLPPPQNTQTNQLSALFGGSLHVLVNNVGTNIRKPTTEYTEVEYDSIMNVNLKSVYNLCQLAHPLLKAAAGSVVINIGSVAGVTAIKSGEDRRDRDHAVRLSFPIQTHTSVKG